MAEQVGAIEYDARIQTKNLKSSGAEAEQIAKKTGENIGDSVERGTTKANEAFSRFAKTLGFVMLVGGAAAATGLGIAIKSAGDYQSSLSKLNQASGATGEQMTMMSKLARELGQSNDLAGVSAADAAATMLELSKAGLSVKDTMDSSKAVMSLAKAGNIEFADAAVIAASALNAFGLQGKDAIKVADTLAAGANASQAELGDLALGMQQSATVAKQFGLSLNESVTALALFANNGIKGSDAGTSLKTMLIALAKPSDAAAEAMDNIGFEAYNAEGQFVGLDEMSKRLKKSTENLTAEQKQNTLATIFGTDAFRAAAVLSDNAGDSYLDMSKKLQKAGAAQKAAAAQLGPFEKSTEGLKNSMSELGLTVGTYVLPTVTQMTTNVSKFVQSVNGSIPGAINTFKTLTPVITSLGAGMAAFVIVQNAAGVSTRALTVAQGALNFVLRANPFALAAAGAVAIVTAYAGVVTGSDSTKNAADRLKLAQDNLKASTDRLKLSEQAVTEARLARVGSDIAVQRAEERLTQLKNSGTASALDLKEAEYSLATAKEAQRQATQNESTALSANTAEKRVNKTATDNLAPSNYALGSSAYSAAGGYQALSSAIREASSADKKTGVNAGFGGKNQTNAVFGIPNRASGGPVSANSPYFVGDNPDGSLNKTSELFVPRTAGRIVNSSDLQAALNKSGDGGNKTEYNIGTITISSEVDGERWLQRLTRDSEIISKGMTPRTAYQ